MPRNAKKTFETSEQQIGQTREARIAMEGPAALDIEPIEVVEGPSFKTMAEELLFMEDMLTIRIHASPEPRPEKLIYVGVNGRACYIPRNVNSMVRRKYVERLARSKTDSITQDVTAKDPEDVNKLTISQSHKYPFAVIHDPHPDGHAWLQKILAEG